MLTIARLSTGAYFSAIIILLANCQYYPLHEQARQDHALGANGRKHLSSLVLLNNDEQIGRVMSVLNDLESIAEKAINHYQRHPDLEPLLPTVTQASYAVSHDISSHEPFNDLVSEVYDLSERKVNRSLTCN
jgi:hypothetical protein